ncbi:MAG: hypothetical protein V7K46_19855 [Nostoc sp.]
MVISPVMLFCTKLLFSTTTKQHHVFLAMGWATRRREAACRRHRTAKL